MGIVRWLVSLYKDEESLLVKVVLVVVLVAIVLVLAAWAALGAFANVVLVADLRDSNSRPAHFLADVLAFHPWPWPVSAGLAAFGIAFLGLLTLQQFKKGRPAPVRSAIAPATASPKFATATRTVYIPSPGKLGVQVTDDQGAAIVQATAVAVSEKNLRSGKGVTNDQGFVDLSPVVADFTYTVLVAHPRSEGDIAPGVSGAAGFRPVTLPYSDRFESWILSDGGDNIDGLDTRLFLEEESDGSNILRAIHPYASINGLKAGQLVRVRLNETATIEDSRGAKIRLRPRFIEGGTSLVRVFRLTNETRTSRRAEQIIAALPKRPTVKQGTLNLAQAAREAVLAYHGHLEDDEPADNNMRASFQPEISRVVERLEKRLKRRSAAREVNLLSVSGWAALADALEDDAAEAA